MAPAKRWIHLTAALLDKPMTKEAIIQQVPGYQAPTTPAARERVFERDKAALRDCGVPLEITYAPGDDRIAYYSIDPARWQGGQLTPTPMQTALLALTRHILQAEISHLAVTKLLALSPQAVAETSVHLTTTVQTDIPAAMFDDLARAIAERRQVEFNYEPASSPAGIRRLYPWVLRQDMGAWYVLGFDIDRQGPRWFRLSRIHGEVELGPVRDYEIPAEPATVRHPTESSATIVTLAVRPDTGFRLRRQGRIKGQLGKDDVIEVETSRLGELVEIVAASAGDIVPLAPASVVAQVRARWEKAVGYAS